MTTQPDSEVQEVLDALEEEGVPEMNTLSVEDARRLLTELFTFEDDQMDPIASVEDGSVPGRDRDIPIRTYTPEGQGSFPLLVYYHGGGWILGNLDTHDAVCRALANTAECVVVSVDYGLAPQSPFPGPVKDCYDATEYIVENAESFGGHANRVAIGGDSAGGNLAAAVAQLARDQNGPEFTHQLLIYPVTNHSFDTDSYEENAEGYFLTKADMEWFWNYYLDDELHRKNPYASPLQAHDLSDLPSASVFTAGFDPLRDEGIAYAERLDTAGVNVTHHHYGGAIHGFFGMLVEPEIPQARDAVSAAANDLQQSFQ